MDSKQLKIRYNKLYNSVRNEKYDEDKQFRNNTELNYVPAGKTNSDEIDNTNNRPKGL